MISSIIRDKLDFLSKRRGVKSVAIVGSAAYSNTYHDIDILLLIENLTEAKEIIEKFSKEYNTPFSVCDDSYRFVGFGTHELSLVPKSITSIQTSINRILKGKNLNRRYVTWAVGGFFPETLILDIEKSLTYWEDNTKQLTKLKQFIRDNKKDFFISLIKELTEEINLKTKYLDLKAPNKIYLSTLISDIQVATIRKAFATDGQLFRGLKSYQKDLPKISHNSRKIIKKVESMATSAL